MSNKELKMVESIREDYVEKKRTKLNEMMALDRKAKMPATVFTYTFGIISTLVAGTGMCLSMQVIGGTPLLTAIGIGVGIIGFIFAGINYPIYKKILEKGKKKYARILIKKKNR